MKELGPFSVCKNGGILPLEFTDEVPEDFLKYEPKADTDKIRESLNAGALLTFAKFSERRHHLRMKV